MYIFFSKSQPYSSFSDEIVGGTFGVDKKTLDYCILPSMCYTRVQVKFYMT